MTVWVLCTYRYQNNAVVDNLHNVVCPDDSAEIVGLSVLHELPA